MTYFFFNDTATTEIYTLSLHDALPICLCPVARPGGAADGDRQPGPGGRLPPCTQAQYVAGPLGGPAILEDSGRHGDRKSTRLNSSHANISYAVFCLKKKINRS